MEEIELEKVLAHWNVHGTSIPSYSILRHHALEAVAAVEGIHAVPVAWPLRLLGLDGFFQRSAVVTASA